MTDWLAVGARPERVKVSLVGSVGGATRAEIERVLPPTRTENGAVVRPVVSIASEN